MDETFRNRTFRDTDFSGSTFRDVDMSGVTMVEALLVGADISGLIIGLTINGVEVAPLISRELDRLHPERVELRATDEAGVRRAWDIVEQMWQPTMARAEQLSEAERQARIDGEWSFVETLRHLIFVTDAWFSRTVLGESQPYHPFALPPTFLGDGEDLGIDVTATPTFHEVAAVRAERMAMLRSAIAGMTAAELDRLCDQNAEPGYPPVTTERVITCLHGIFDEEWAHHQYAVRDLSRLEQNG